MSRIVINSEPGLPEDYEPRESKATERPEDNPVVAAVLKRIAKQDAKIDRDEQRAADKARRAEQRAADKANWAEFKRRAAEAKAQRDAERASKALGTAAMRRVKLEARCMQLRADLMIAEAELRELP